MITPGRIVEARVIAVATKGSSAGGVWCGVLFKSQRYVLGVDARCQ